MKLYSRHSAVALVAVAALAGQPAAGQYSPYGATTPQQGYAAQQPMQPATAPTGYAPQNYPATTGYAPLGAYTPQQQTPYLRTAQAPGSARQLPAPTEAIGAPAVTPSVAPMATTPAPQMASGAAVATSYPTATVGGSDGGCNTAAPATNWEGYMPSNGGCATGDCGTGSCDTGGYSYQECGDASYACGDYCNAAPQRQWFAGLYGLYMGRDNPGKVVSTVEVNNAPTGTYYPQPDTDTFFFTSEADIDFTGGAEVRFGSTFGCATDPCGCMSYQPFAWELAYWALDEDSSFAEITDNFGGSRRLYGAINYAGLEYDRDAGGGTWSYRPVNDYYDYQKPVDSTSTNDVRVLAVRTTQSFEVQNLELNFWRFGAPAVGPTCCGGGAGLGGGLGSGMLRNALRGGQSGCGSCGSSCGGDACGYGACSTACCAAPAPRCRFSINGLAGVRYLKMDEFFRNAVFFTRDDGSGGVATGEPNRYRGSMPEDDNVLFHDVEVDNELLGFQLGSSMNWLVGCRWALFCDTNFGIYGNQIDAYQRVFSPGGGRVRFVETGEDAAIRSSKEDVAFLGEARCGVGYQITPRCRLTSAYRVIAITGVALAPGQISTPANEDVWRHIDSNDSIVIHGFQGGVEFKY